MENTSDSLMPRPLLLCLKSEKIVCYSVPDNTSAREGKSFQDSLVDIQDVLLHSEDSVTANKRAVDLFGKSYANIATAVRDGRLSFTNMSDSMSLLKDSTDSVNSTFDDSLDTWDEMGVAINNLKTIGGRMM